MLFKTGAKVVKGREFERIMTLFYSSLLGLLKKLKLANRGLNRAYRKSSMCL